MPWTAADAKDHNKDATGHLATVWAKAANAALDQYDGDEGKAVAVANAAVADAKKKEKEDDRQASEPSHGDEKKHGSGGGRQKKEGDDDDEEEPDPEDPEEDDEKENDKKKGRTLTATAPEMVYRDEQLSIKPNSYAAKDRIADVMMSSGAKVRRQSFFEGDFDEVLDMTPKAIRAGRLNGGASLLDSHDFWNGLDAKIGAVVPGSVRIEGGKLWGKIQLNRSAKGQRVAEDLEDGIPTHVSVGYKVHKAQRDETTSPPTVRAVDWEPYELSIVTVPAEDAARVRHLHHQSRAHAPATKEDKQMSLEAQTTEQNGGEVLDTNRQSTELVTQDFAAEARKAVEAERTRVSSITAICRQGNLPMELAEKAIESGVAVEEFRATAFEELAKRSGATPIVGGNGSTGGQVITRPNGRLEIMRDESEGRVDAAAEGLVTQILASRRVPALRSAEQMEWAKFMGRTDMVARSFRVLDGHEQPINPRAKEYLGKGWVEIAAECCGYRGNILNPKMAYDIVFRAFHSTSDFPAIFENALNKSLLARYQIALPTYRDLAIERQFNDFRPHRMIRTGDFPQLEPVPETGELKAGTTQEGKEMVSIAPYGIIFRISRQMIVNDEMGAIDEIMANSGQSVLVFENSTFFQMFLANPLLMTDSKPVFDPAHGNYVTPGQPPDITALGVARASLRVQKSLGGAVLNIPPSIILAGPLNETLIDQLLTTIIPNQFINVNPFSGKLRAVIDANITDHSWYVLAEPGALPNFVYGFLAGAGGPRTRTDQPFGVQGVQMSLEHDFGCGPVDYRGAFKNAGTGTLRETAPFGAPPPSEPPPPPSRESR